jgi:hypothetical protein
MILCARSPASLRAGLFTGPNSHRLFLLCRLYRSYRLFLALTLACAGPRQDVDPAPHPEADGFSLILNSHHLMDVNIFVQHDGQADRVAMVPASTPVHH